MFARIVADEDGGMDSRGAPTDPREQGDRRAQGGGEGEDAGRHANAALVEGVVDEMREACRRVRDGWRDLWR